MRLPTIEGQELGRYRVGAPISKNVYRTYDRLRENDIGLKAYPADSYSPGDEGLMQENIFQLEAQLLGPAKHPHILPVLNTGNSYISGVPFVFKTMPLCEGSLADWLWEHGGNKVFEPRDVFPILMQLSEALQFAHENRVLYQNFKFSNILIQASGKSLGELHLMLADFAAVPEGAFFMPTQESHPYVAPERWVGRVLPASDQYGLAAMMYELLAGRPPFQKATEQTMRHMHTSMPPQPPSTYNLSLPMSVNMVLLKALAKRPEDRFASTLLFAEAFRKYCI
jgi:serine/threonine protein kinase